MGLREEVGWRAEHRNGLLQGACWAEAEAFPWRVGDGFYRRLIALLKQFCEMVTTGPVFTVRKCAFQSELRRTRMQMHP